MHRTALLSCSISTACLVTLGACGDGGGRRGDVDFGSATAAQRERAAIAGIGGDALIAYLVGGEIGTLPPTTLCPTVVQTGLTFTATYNCDDSDGQRIDGRVTATNIAYGAGGPEIDPTQDGTLVFEDFYLHRPVATDDIVLDGTIQFGRFNTDESLIVGLDARLDGIAVRTDALFSQDGGRTSAEDGDRIEVEGLGGAFIRGAWNTSSASRGGALELSGADVLRVDFDAWADGCAPMTIDGRAAGQLCGI